ncbi:hypothetical protein E4T39_03065 [Aureobasidium subglaciale]|nr:hypothetical protein E4T39_03065 [Aureobasidium subglaciale]
MSNITLPLTTLSRRSMFRPTHSAVRRSSWSAGNEGSLAEFLGEDDQASTVPSSLNEMQDCGFPEDSSNNEDFECWAVHPFWQGVGHHPRVYNSCNSLTADVVVRFGGGRFEFLSEKAILSAKSEFFKRAFSSNFAVATSQVIDLGDEDNSKHIYAMLRFIHGTAYTTIHQRSSVGRNLDFHIDLYLIGEQFDCRDLRHAAADVFFHEAIFLADTHWFPKAVQRILGADAAVLADKFLIDVTVKICVEQVETLVKNKHFMEMALAGDLVDEGGAMKLFLTLGQRVRELSGADVWMSREERLVRAQTELLAAEAALGPVSRSSLAGQIIAARAYNAAHMAVTNAAMITPQPMVAPFAALTSHPPPPAPANHTTVAHRRASVFNK